MAMPTIKTRCNTASGTRAYTNRLGTRASGQGGSASRFTRFPSGGGAEPSPVPVYLVDTLTGVKALIKHRRQQYAKELAATLECEVEVESQLTQRFADWRTALEALASAHDLAHAAQTSGQSWWTYSFPESIPDELVPDGGTENAREELETINWDVKIEQLPPRRSEQVVVKFIQGSYRPPRIIDNPED